VRWPPASKFCLSKELVVRESTASKDRNMEDEELTALEAVTRRQQVKYNRLRRLRTCCSECELALTL
jgi:hypothetical protein